MMEKKGVIEEGVTPPESEEVKAASADDLCEHLSARLQQSVARCKDAVARCKTALAVEPKQSSEPEAA